MKDKITIDQWVKMEIERIDEFVRWYKRQSEKELASSSFPKNLSTKEWYKRDKAFWPFDR